MLQKALERYKHIPELLKSLPNWCIAGPDKAPYKMTSTGVHAASNRKREDWTTFQQAIEGMIACGAPAIGFCLTNEDGVACIDLDVKDKENAPTKPEKWTTQEQLDRYVKIVNIFDSYTERSQSGKGIHIWVQGSIGVGANRDGVEVYSQERFIVCTGDVYIDKPVEERQELLTMLLDEIRATAQDRNFQLVEIEPIHSDQEIYERAVGAGNADKFNKLMAGDWVGDYKSQSEADLALLSMFTFYSKSNEQCRRLFRCSGLGTRAKATKDDRYLNFTLEIIRSRQQREAIMDAHGEQVARALVQKLQTSSPADQLAANVVTAQPLPDVSGTVEWPPGLAGQIAGHIYSTAPRPVKEVAIIAALGFLAGVCGRAYNYSRTGLNLYLTLVARSGVGKETMHAGISGICEALRDVNPAAQTFVDFTEFASGQGLTKACAVAPSFLNVSGEWGRKLQRMASDDRPDSPMATLRTQMTNLFQKSGKGMMVGGLGYSNTDQNVSMKTGVAYSMIGETTPGTFYQGLTQSMMEDGFLSRFIIMEYTGDRPPSNPNAGGKMLPELKQSLAGLCSQALANNSRDHIEEVQVDADAKQLMDKFDLECDNNINASTDESIRQMWNRAHLKMFRVAALLGVADNWVQPVIRLVHVQWALALIRRDIVAMSSRMADGDVGAGDDHTRYLKLINLLRDFFTSPQLARSYKIPEEMKANGYVPFRFIQQRISQLAQFRNARNGSKAALENAIRTAIDSGYLAEASRERMLTDYAYSGKVFRILDLPNLTE